MKKLIFAAVAVLGFMTTQAQDGGFKIGVHAGLPIGTFGDFYSFNAGVDAAYMWPVADKFQLGATTGYSYFAGKEFLGVKVNGGFVPVAASGQYSFTDNLFGGLDLGYAAYAGDGNGDGGVYYQAKFGYQADAYELYAGYKAISATGGSVATIGLGFNYKFN